MCWLWLAFISLGGYGQVSFVNGSGVVSHAFASCAVWLYVFSVFTVPRTTKAANSVFWQRLAYSLSAFVRAALGYSVLLEPNMALNRSAVTMRFYFSAFRAAPG